MMMRRRTLATIGDGWRRKRTAVAMEERKRRRKKIVIEEDLESAFFSLYLSPKQF